MKIAETQRQHEYGRRMLRTFKSAAEGSGGVATTWNTRMSSQRLYSVRVVWGVFLSHLFDTYALLLNISPMTCWIVQLWPDDSRLSEFRKEAKSLESRLLFEMDLKHGLLVRFFACFQKFGNSFIRPSRWCMRISCFSAWGPSPAKISIFKRCMDYNPLKDTTSPYINSCDVADEKNYSL